MCAKGSSLKCFLYKFQTKIPVGKLSLIGQSQTGKCLFCGDVDGRLQFVPLDRKLSDTAIVLNSVRRYCRRPIPSIIVLISHSNFTKKYHIYQLQET